MRYYTAIILCIALVSSGCKKLIEGIDNNTQQTCDNISNFSIQFAGGPVTIGEPIVLSVPDLGTNTYARWNGPKLFNDLGLSQNIRYAQLENEGWYHVSMSNVDCETAHDSVYVDVRLQQGTPACIAALNTIQFSNLFNSTFRNMNREIDPTYNVLSLAGTGGGQASVFFHDKWLNKEPEDGIYSTINVPSFDQLDGNYNKVYVSMVKDGIYWSSDADQQVFVSHVNGKLQVRFCALGMGGNNGNSYRTSASGNFIEQ